MPQAQRSIKPRGSRAGRRRAVAFAGVAEVCIFVGMFATPAVVHEVVHRVAHLGVCDRQRDCHDPVRGGHTMSFRTRTVAIRQIKTGYEARRGTRSVVSPSMKMRLNTSDWGISRWKPGETSRVRSWPNSGLNDWRNRHHRSPASRSARRGCGVCRSCLACRVVACDCGSGGQLASRNGVAVSRIACPLSDALPHWSALQRPSTPERPRIEPPRSQTPHFLQ